MNDDRNYFCVCAFIDKIFMIGGVSDGVITISCLQFDTIDKSWNEVVKMKEARSSAACVVFGERIIVSGGYSNNLNVLNFVESYDVLPNTWSTMPNMNSGKYDHSLVVVKNKMFVISNRKDNCEVFDNISNKFIYIKSPEFNRFSWIIAKSIKSKVFFFKTYCQKQFLMILTNISGLKNLVKLQETFDIFLM